MVVALIYDSFNTFYVYAYPPAPGFGSYGAECSFDDRTKSTSCCFYEEVPPGTGNPDLGGNLERYCQTCKYNENGEEECTQKELQFFEGRTPGLAEIPEDGVLEEPPTPPSGPAAPLQDGGVLQQPPSQGEAPPLTRDQGVLPQDGVLQQPPADDGTDCPGGQVLDEETGLCVLEEPEAAEEEPQQSEQQSSEEEEESEDNSNDDGGN